MNIYCFSTLSFAKLQFKSVINKAFHKHGVASFTDAWIETGLEVPPELRVESHLLQMRGLKHKASKEIIDICSRIFYRCVDWNINLETNTIFIYSRIFYRCVDWNPLETYRYLVYAVASFTDAWIETRKAIFKLTGLLSRIFYRCVDWNRQNMGKENEKWGRIFYRCVDWNR